MESFKALFKRSTSDASDVDGSNAELRQLTKAWQDIYSQLSAACDAEVKSQASGSKKKHKPYSLPADPVYLDLLRPALSGQAIVYDHGNAISRVRGDITDFSSWHRCSFVCNDGLLYLFPSAIFVSTKPLATVRFADLRIDRSTIITSSVACLCLGLNSVVDGSSIFTIAFSSEESMTQFYKLALKASLILTPPPPLAHSELLTLMFRNSSDVRDIVINSGIPDTMRAAFWTILSGAEIALERNPGLFERLCSQETRDLQEKHVTDKIRRDIHRTFPEDRFFQSAPKFVSRRMEADQVAAAVMGGGAGAEAAVAGQSEVHLGQGQEMLLLVNRAYSLHDKAIGYCQGMNFIVAGIIMHQRKPELIFWILDRIMHHYRLGSWFVVSTPDLSIALFRISAIFALQNPKLHAHYNKFGVDIGTTVCHKWIATLFIDPFHSHSPEFSYRIFDMFFVHGPNFLIRLCVALLVYKPHAAEVLAKTSFEGVIDAVRGFCSQPNLTTPAIVTALFKLAMSLEWDEEALVIHQKAYVEQEVKMDFKPPDWFLRPVGASSSAASSRVDAVEI